MSSPSPTPAREGEGFHRLAGGSYRDSGERLGVAKAGQLVDATVEAALPRTVTHNFALARRALRVWRHMPESWRRHVNGVTVRELRVSRELMVYADSSAWVYELQMRREEVCVLWNSLCDRLGEDLNVQSASFKLSRRAFQRGESYALSSSSHASERHVPLSAEEKVRVEDTVARSTDERLRKSVQDAMTAMLEWKKSKPAR